MTYAAILVAAGRSTRMGSDKLWEDLWGRPAWRWSLDVLLTDADLASVAIAVPSDALDRFIAALPPGDGRCLVIPGGDTRPDSVIAGIWALTGAGHDDDLHALVDGHGVEAAGEVTAHRLVHGVVHVGTIQGDGRHVLRHGIGDRLVVAHRMTFRFRRSASSLSS